MKPNMVLGAVRKHGKRPAWIRRLLPVCIAGYGVYAFIARGIGRYLFLMDHFVFFDFGEPVALFLMDYVSVMILFAWMGYWLRKWLCGRGARNRTKS